MQQNVSGEKSGGTLLLYWTTVNTKIFSLRFGEFGNDAPYDWFKKNYRPNSEGSKFLCSARFQNQSLVAGAAGGLIAVEVFEQGDGVFA